MAGRDLRNIDGTEKAAIVMLALGDEHGLPLWRLMDEEEIREVSQAMSNLGQVSSDTVENLLHEFVSKLSSTGSVTGSYEGTERLLR